MPSGTPQTANFLPDISQTATCQCATVFLKPVAFLVSDRYPVLDHMFDQRDEEICA